MRESILFKGVDLVFPDGIKTGDMLVRNGKIQDIDWKINQTADAVVSEKGLTVLPGVIDPHVHFREPGSEHKETIQSGSYAAAVGGVTTFFDMPNTHPLAINEAEIQRKKDIAAQTSLVNYNFFIGASDDNLDVLNSIENVAGIKIYMGQTTGDLILDDSDVLETIVSKGSRIITVHAEDVLMIAENAEKYAGAKPNPCHHYMVRSPEAALKATQKIVALSEKYQRRVHIAHLTTEEELQFLQSRKPAFVTTEVCPHHLFLYGPDIYDKIGVYAQVNPPIRDRRHQEALWAALKNGAIDMIASDHAPHTVEEKSQPYGAAPSGMPGVETSLSLMLDQVHRNQWSLLDVTRWMSLNPAKVYGIQNKGELKVGYDADLVVVDMNAQKTIRNGSLYTKCNWSAFDGRTLKGVPLMTFVNGQMVYREGDIFDEYKGKEVQFC